ncbi:alcohol dehydrogenase [Setomelanomma holmii]|uniref:Alcohol dehydrogenase n=1 Tax=Setomelanomma holmii TaxID=210430 RepID=A0A9P4LFY0_9PLEO|nr:alcohol dehydrogenase [Setomelanomma holmii]
MSSLPTHRDVFRLTNDPNPTPTSPRLRFTTEPLPSTLPATSVLIKLHAISLNYRDANITFGKNPWPVRPDLIPCNDAAGTIIATGLSVTRFAVGDRVAPNTDMRNLTGREKERSWLAADEDGVCASYLVLDERVLAHLPSHLSFVEASVLPCAGVTAWSALKGVGIGNTILIQGTGGVAMLAIKLALATGCRVILSSSSDEKIAGVREKFGDEIVGVNYKSLPEWHEEVLRLTDGAGVDCVVEVGGTASIVRSLKCTRRGGFVSVVGYLSKDDGLEEMKELLPLLIDRRINLRGINAGSVQDLSDLCAAVTATQMRFDDIIDSARPFEEAEEAIRYVWEGNQVGKVVLTMECRGSDHMA